MNRKFVGDVLMALGSSPANKGFDYILDAVMFIHNDKSYLHGITTLLYPDVARFEDCTTSQVERCIRYEVSRMLRNDEELLIKLGCGLQLSKISNRSFLAALERYMAKQYSLQSSMKRSVMA